MVRKAALAASLAAVAWAVFAGTSSALQASDRPVIRSNLAVAAFPAQALPQSEATAVNDLIGVQLADRAGITADSFEEVRRIGQTVTGPAYFIPGSHGACIAVVAEAVVCGDPGAPGIPSIALASFDARSNRLSGIGVAATTVNAIALETRAENVPLPLANGVFRINTSAPRESIRGFAIH
ncbi:MAG TPA: hypothetical protein VF101_18720 [Gaiellaceae bacterium]